MTENQFQTQFIKFIHSARPNSVFVPKFRLSYNVGKYEIGKEFGMPDIEMDVVEMDENNEFHLWELKLITNAEIWNGKILGQFLLYDLLFRTEPWNELYGRFIVKNSKKNNGILGNISKLLEVIFATETEENTIYEDDKMDCVIGSDPTCSFCSWNLVVLGGGGYELAEGYNPMIWTLDDLYFEKFSDPKPKLNIYQFYETQKGIYEFKNMKRMSISIERGLSRFGWQSFKKDYPNWKKMV